MPSDERVRDALQALQHQTQAFRSTLARTADEVGQLLRAQDTTAETKAMRLAAELGPFARGRIAVDRFAQVFDYRPGANGGARTLIRRAHETLVSLLGRGDAIHHVTVDPGASLRDAVAVRLADLGRAFGAARVARFAQTGASPDRYAPALEQFPFALWSRSERDLAPPLVIEVRGADLWAASLVEFLDGRLKLVLVVTGEASPAPLARLIAPSLYVQQAVAASELGALASWDGPGVAALVPDTSARFVHHPRSGRSPAERLTVAFAPSAPPRKSIAGMSASQQADELALLAALAQPAAVPGAAAPSPGPTPPTADPVDLLASWLLAQAKTAS
jgi:hypothetical protein